MSVDLNALASDFGCSTDDVKVMLSEIVVSLDDIFVAIDALIEENDCASIAELGEMVKGKINHFNLEEMNASASGLVDAASSGDSDGCKSSFGALKANLDEVKGLL